MANNIYSVDYSQYWENTLPPEYRVAENIAWGKVFMKPIQWLFDLFFVTYADGFTGVKWGGLAYNKGDRVRDEDHSVYEALSNVAALSPQPRKDPTNWLKIQDNWIGVRERSKYNGQKIVLEYALNKWFDTNFHYKPILSDIYIVNNLIFVNLFKIGLTGANSSFIPKNATFGQNAIPKVASIGSQNAFTIYIPLAVYNALSTDAPSREQIVRAFADQYVIAGITYNIATY